MFIKNLKISCALCFYPLLTEQSCVEEVEEKEDKFVSLQTHAARDLNILNWLLRYNNSINKKSHTASKTARTQKEALPDMLILPFLI